MKKLLIKAIAVVTAATVCLICGCTKTSDSKNDSQPEEISKNSIAIQEKENLNNKKTETKTKVEKTDNKVKVTERKKAKEEETKEKEKENSSLVEEVSTESIESSIEISYDEEEIEESEEEINDFSMITASEEITAYAAAPEVIEEEISYEEVYDDDSYFTCYTSDEFYDMGIIEWGEWSWTYYSEVYMPGEDLPIPGRWTDENGYVCDENNYICLASSSLPKGTIIDTPFGKMGKVYDCGCLDYIIDVYVSWY